MSLQPWLAPRWRYVLSLPPSFSAEPGHVPAPGHAPAPLAVYRWGSLTLRVYGVELTREVDLHDWLSVSPLGAGRPHPEHPPEVSDDGRLVRRATVVMAGAPRLRVVVARRSGARVFLMRYERPVDVLGRRDELAFIDEVEAAIASFRPDREPPSPHVEPMRPLQAERPQRWRCVLPLSWLLEPQGEPAGPQILSAVNVRIDATMHRTVVGRLSAVLLPRAPEEAPRDVAQRYVDAVANAGLDIREEQVVKERPRPPFAGAWHVDADCQRGGQRGTLRCRVLRHGDLWWLGGVIGLTATSNRQAWLENRRALDIATRSLRLA